MPRDKIFTVARIFTYLGWPLIVLFGLLAVMSVLMAPVLLFSDGEGREGVIGVLIGGALFAAFAYVGRLYLTTAKRLRSRDPEAAKTATLLCMPLLLGFPIFTIAGIYCFVLLGAYPDYLASEQVEVSDD
jgi:hypothetical protein